MGASRLAVSSGGGGGGGGGGGAWWTVVVVVVVVVMVVPRAGLGGSGLGGGGQGGSGLQPAPLLLLYLQPTRWTPSPGVCSSSTSDSTMLFVVLSMGNEQPVMIAAGTHNYCRHMR